VQDHDSLLIAISGLLGFILILMRWMFSEMRKEAKLRTELGQKVVGLERRIVGQAAEITRMREAYTKLRDAYSRLWVKYTEVQAQLNKKNAELLEIALSRRDE
jgi:hypothetical protein